MKSLAKQLAKQLGLSGDKQQQQQQPQQQCGTPPAGSKQEQTRQAKAAAKAAAAGQPRPKGPSGPCGTPCCTPEGGVTHALPLAAALSKGCAPWCTTGTPDARLVRLLPGQGASGDALRVFYPAGSGPPSSGLRGGVTLRGLPPFLPANDAVLRLRFRTAPDMDWTRGGKLGGGLHIGKGNAAGYLHSDTGASARLVWGPNGSLMLYAYTMEGAEQDPSYTSVARLGGGCGDHMFPGTFQAQRGEWTDVTLRVRLNTPGRADGVAGLGVNGRYVQYDRMVWRSPAAADARITQVLLNTFFGGSWVTPADTHIDFADFSVTVLG